MNIAKHRPNIFKHLERPISDSFSDRFGDFTLVRRMMSLMVSGRNIHCDYMVEEDIWYTTYGPKTEST